MTLPVTLWAATQGGSCGGFATAQERGAVCGRRGRAQQVGIGESGGGQGAMQSVVGGTHTPVVLPAEPRGGRTTGEALPLRVF
jgi:predicted dienelactone hydrolase